MKKGFIGQRSTKIGIKEDLIVQRSVAQMGIVIHL